MAGVLEGGGGQVANFIMLLSSWLLSPEREQRGCYVVNVLFMPRLQSISLKRVRCVQFYCMQTHVTHSYIYRDTHSNMHTYNALHANTHTRICIYMCSCKCGHTQIFKCTYTCTCTHTHETKHVLQKGVKAVLPSMRTRCLTLNRKPPLLKHLRACFRKVPHNAPTRPNSRLSWPRFPRL